MKALTFLLPAIVLIGLSPGVIVAQAFATSTAESYANPSIIISHPTGVSPNSATVVGLTPTQIRHFYGLDTLTCYSTNACGSGQTVAIVDAFDDPGIESDLGVFSSQFGLPACTTANGCFTKAEPQGVPRANRSWALEISLDVEWVHAIAPGAKILLVESLTNSNANLFSAVD